MPRNHCFGCGAENPKGMQIKSYWNTDTDAEAICEYRPQAHHMAGPTHVLNGGIIAALIDCHCICTAVADAYRREGREMEQEPLIWYVTGTLRVKYLRPTPIAEPVVLRARLVEIGEKKTVLSCSFSSGGQTTAEGELVAIRVPPTWMDAS